MKKIIATIIVTFAIVSFSFQEAQAQCRQQMVYTCATKGQSIYLRDFNTKLKSSNNAAESGSRWTVVLNKDGHYRFNLCTPEGFEKKVILTLYDSQHPEKKPIGSTYVKTTGKHHDSFDFICLRSGMYYVSIRFKEGVSNRKTCAVGILSFVGSN